MTEVPLCKKCSVKRQGPGSLQASGGHSQHQNLRVTSSHVQTVARSRFGKFVFSPGLRAKLNDELLLDHPGFTAEPNSIRPQ